jgi:serine/threonine protein kinase/tetratricopeptide (TPR) repeat protein
VADLLDRLKTALADRYRIERELGRGGMATVYLAEDLKHHRPVAVKVMRPELAQTLGSERFLREIELSARLAHPHILPLHDSGDADGFLFFVMPFIEGESLRDRLTREGQLPLEDALQIAHEVAEALSYAHSHDVLHRDIKPENILLQSGHALVADFGIARAITAAGGERLTETGISLGTPAYMSPEQSMGERVIDGRSDLYSLGCVLYEMLAGEPPFTGPTAQAIFARRMTDPLPSVSVMRESVPPTVEAALAKALARAPADRFTTAQQFAAALPTGWQPTGAPRARRPRRVKRWMAIPAVVVAALAVVGGLRLLSSSGIDFAARDWIVLTEFDNQTGDSVFEGSLNSALTVGLQQSRYVNVLPRTRIAEVLAQMERPDTTRLDEAVGREVALRANVRVFVVPAISRIDSTYLLTTRIVDPQTGTDLLTRSARAEGKAEVLSALDKLAQRLRRDLGESRRDVAHNGLALDHATTPSLEALRAWTEGNRYWNTRRLDDAAERYRRALSLDSNFAMAHEMLGQYHFWQARRDSSEYHFAKALSQLDRVTERERLSIQASFYGARANWDAAIRAQETYVERYPDDLSQRYNLGTAYMRADRHEDAIRTLRQVVAVDSTNVSAFVNLATTYARMGDYAAALPEYRRAFALRPDYRLSGNLNHEFGFDFVQLGELDSAEVTFTVMLDQSPQQQAGGQRSLALLRMYEGRYADARSHLQRAITLTHSLGAPVSEFRNLLYLATTYASTEDTRSFRAALRDASTIADTVFLAPSWLARLAAGYARLGDTVALSRLVSLIEQRVTEGNKEDQAAAAGTEAELALARGDYANAVALLQQAVLASGTSGADEYRPALALAYRLTGDPVQAESTYLAMLATGNALGWEPQEGWILAHYELGKLYQERGDTAKAVDFYDRFLTIWEDADPNLVALADARKRLRGLSGPG